MKLLGSPKSSSAKARTWILQAEALVWVKIVKIGYGPQVLVVTLSLTHTRMGTRI